MQRNAQHLQTWQHCYQTFFWTFGDKNDCDCLDIGGHRFGDKNDSDSLGIGGHSDKNDGDSLDTGGHSVIKMTVTASTMMDKALRAERVGVQ